MKNVLSILLLSAFLFACEGQQPKGKNSADQEIKKSTAMENVYIFDEAFYIPQLDRYRRIWVYLPPDYESSTRHYPVLYMHDGQNLFDGLTSFVGEWGVDETLNQLFEEGFPGIIVVGIDHGSEERLNEYSPWINENHGGGLGGQYALFLTQTLKPVIDENFRTLSDPKNTGVGGSSMGGLISLYLTLQYPEVFSKSLIFSPAFWFTEESYEFAEGINIDSGLRMYFLAGGKEYSHRSVPKHTQKMIDILTANGLTKDQYRYVDDPKGKHNEKFWQKHFADAVRFLFE